MKNLTSLLEKEGRWYRIGPISIPRGVPKRAPITFGITLVVTLGLSQVPLTPFWFIQQISDNGWAVNVVVIPAVMAAIFSSAKIKGKKPERYLLSMLRFRFSPKHVTPYRTLEGAKKYTFGTVYTVRKEEEKDESALSHPTHRGERDLQLG